MYRNARVTFHTTRFGGETVTDTFRVWFVRNDWWERQDTEVRRAVHATGERDCRVISWSWAD